MKKAKDLPFLKECEEVLAEVMKENIVDEYEYEEQEEDDEEDEEMIQ